jgi:hypothetical protein
MAARLSRLRQAISVATFMCAGLAQAESGTGTATSPVPASVDAPLPDDGKPRPKPNYRGRAESAPISQQLLWIPRVALAPAYVAADMAARPLAILATYAERDHWRVRIYDFFTFGSENQVGIFPTGRIDLGFRPSAGVYFFWNDIWGASDVRARAMSGGSDLWTADIAWRWRNAALGGHFSERPDSAFYGFGGSSSSVPARFGERHLELTLRHRERLSTHLSAALFVGHEVWALDADPDGAGEASLARAIADRRLPVPPALEDGLMAVFGGIRGDFDTRRGRLVRSPRETSDYDHVSGSGVTFRPFATAHVGLAETRSEEGERVPAPAWMDYGLMASGTVDLTGTQRRLELELYSSFVDPFPKTGPIPFTHLAALGGARPLRGFGARRLVDRSALAATLRYAWPIWTELDGSVHAAAGNVFGPHLDGLQLPRLRASFGIGVVTAAASDHPFELLLACGTEPFEAGARLQDVRLTVGTAANF